MKNKMLQVWVPEYQIEHIRRLMQAFNDPSVSATVRSVLDCHIALCEEWFATVDKLGNFIQFIGLGTIIKKEQVERWYIKDFMPLNKK